MACARRPAQRGITLVEVLVALSVGALIATAGMVLAQVLAAVNREQAQIQALMDNLRGALMQVASDARLAGAGMAGGDATNAASSSPARLGAITVLNSSTAPDRLDLLTIPGSALATTFGAVNVGSNTILVDATGGAGFAPGDYALLTDFTNGVLYQLSAVSAATVSGISARALSVSAPLTFPVTQYPPGSLLMRAAVVRYSVGLGTTVGLPTTSVLLVSDGAPVGVTGTDSLAAENVYDLQIALGIDGAGGQAVDGRLTEVGMAAGDDEWIYNVAGETLPASPYVLRAIRVTIVGRTSVEGQTVGPGRPRAEDHAAGSADRFRWRLQREVFMVRNLVLQ